ncbi:MAG: exo-beta-N-acetylmuramidase NamZ domain-containing protein [Dissulfurispiraceae bacterium]|jgi:uncharacterized protein YbbC (DUF1343 family)
MTLTGLDTFEKKWPPALIGAKVGLLVHPASVSRKLDHASSLFLKSSKCDLRALFGPQHGIRGETQDNMIEWKGFRDRSSGLPVYSLYSKTRKPRAAMLNTVDVLVVDLQDVGARYYTFIWTMELCMQACAEIGKSVVILDRPNPLGGAIIEGPILQPKFASFVGLRPLPVRHGMTVGEIALYLKDAYYPSLDLHIIKMQGWKRSQLFNETGLPWVLPSPNIPTLDTALVYPGMCLLEGTLLSEGRGTTRPFEIFGAPFIDPDKLVERLNEYKLRGAVFRPLYFQPMFQKHVGEVCGGAQIHLADRTAYRPFKTGVAVLKAVHDLYPLRPLWKSPPYEYEAEKMPVDILVGTDRLKISIENGEPLDNMESWWRAECVAFDKKVRKNYLIYE